MKIGKEDDMYIMRNEALGNRNQPLSLGADVCANTPLLIGKPILVPLTTSLYVPGELADTENVIVDVGTGFYVEKVRSYFYQMSGTIYSLRLTAYYRARKMQ